jgi:diadenosine tetraphosphate (Ap4A) HIT family hydrolase
MMRTSIEHKEQNCFYCSKDEQLQELMIFIDSLQVSNLYLSRDQAHRGRCIIALHEHEKELFHLETKMLHQFTEDVANAAEAITKVVGANKVNYAIYGDLVSHLHFHLVPKFEDGLSWGKAFENSPPKKSLLQESDYQTMIAQLKKQL